MAPDAVATRSTYLNFLNLGFSDFSFEPLDESDVVDNRACAMAVGRIGLERRSAESWLGFSKRNMEEDVKAEFVQSRKSFEKDSGHCQVWSIHNYY
jgi:hypothetical protein